MDKLTPVEASRGLRVSMAINELIDAYTELKMKFVKLENSVKKQTTSKTKK